MTAMYRGRPVATNHQTAPIPTTYRGRAIASESEIAAAATETPEGITAYDLMCHCLTKGFDFITRPDRVKVISWRESNTRRQVTFDANTSLDAILQWVNDRYALMYPELAHLNGHVG